MTRNRRSLALFAVVLLSCTSDTDQTTAPPSPPRVVPPPPLRAVPGSLRETYHGILTAQRSRDIGQVLVAYPRFLKALGAEWGRESPDMAPYFYNYALALKFAGQSPHALAVAEKARTLWPDNLQLRVFRATTLAEELIESGRFDRRVSDQLAALVTEEVLPRLRGLGVDPVQLYSQWGRLVYTGGNMVEALDVIKRGLALSADNKKLLRLQGLALASLERNTEALPLLREVAEFGAATRVEAALAKVLLDSGEAAEAWRWYEALLAAPPAEAGSGKKEPSRKLRLNAARALAALEKPREAAELLLATLRDHPNHVDSLLELSRAARALGASDGAEALTVRARALHLYRHQQTTAGQAREVRMFSSVPFYRGLAALEVDRTGEAILAFEESRRLAPKLAETHLELARVFRLLGRRDLAAERLRSGWATTEEPVMLFEEARVSVAAGDRARARTLLADALRRSAGDPDPEASKWVYGSVERETLLTTRRILALLELGEIGTVRELVAEAEKRGERSEELFLARAELAVLSGDLETAREIHDGIQPILPEAGRWAAAVGALLALVSWRTGDGNEIPSPPVDDPSPLLDHPRFLENSSYTAANDEAGDSERPAGAFLSRLRVLHRQRETRLEDLRGKSDAAGATGWNHLIDLYVEHGALRKAREAAWYLIHLRPDDVEAHRTLIRVLSRPSEVIERLSVIERALVLAPGDEELQKLRREARSFVGGRE